MSPRPCPTGTERPLASGSRGSSAVPTECICDTTDDSPGIDDQQVEPDAVDTPAWIQCQDNFSRRDEARLLANRQSDCRVGQPWTSLDLDDREETILLRHEVDFTGRRAHPAGKNLPAIPFQSCLRGIFGGVTSFVRGLPSTGTIQHGIIVREDR
jgi:hypothetical protein